MHFILIKPPLVDQEKVTALQDISALTGARVLFDVGEFMALRPEDVGFARRLWSTAIKFGIIAGARHGEMLRGRIDAVRTAIANFNDRKDWEQLRKLRWRLAQLTGGMAVLQVGAVTKAAADTRKEHAERLIQVLQAAVGAGLVAGGGAALLACLPAVEQAAASAETLDEQAGVQALAQALSAPMAAIVTNAGLRPAPVLAHVKQAGACYGFDVHRGAVVNMFDAPIVDSLPVVERALQTAASVVAMAVTTTCVVLQRKHYPGRATP
jgi:chaperonin GroEL